MNNKVYCLPKIYSGCLIRSILISMFFTFFLNGAHATEQTPKPEKISVSIDALELEAFLDSLIQQKMKEYHIPGVQFMMVKDGTVLFSKGYGYADLKNEIPVDPERTLFRICSIAKVVTGTAVMQLVEQGMIDLDKDVNDYLTLFKIKNKFPQPVTMRHLLTHTAGFDDMYLNKVGRTPEEQMPLGEFFKEELPPVITPPGEIPTYSNLGNALAGYLVEVVSQQDFADYVRENIFKPLEMTQSRFRLPDSLAPNLVKGYIHKESRHIPIPFESFPKEGDYIPIPFDYLNDYPAGQMVSSATDMGKFMIAHLQKGEYNDQQILKEATIETMHDVQFKHHPKLHGAIGYTWGIGTVRGQKLLAHDGGYVDAATRLWLFPESNIGIYIACNTMNNQLNNDVTYGLAERIFSEVEKDTTTYPIKDLPENNGDVNRFVGAYRFTRYTHRSITKTGVLFGMIAPELRIWRNEKGMILMRNLQGDPRRMIQIEPLLFKSIDDDYYCAFRQYKDGKITHLFTNGTAAFEKVPWYFTISFQQKFFFVCFTILLLISIGITLKFIIRKIKKKTVEITGIEKRLYHFTWLSSSTFLFYLLAFGVIMFYLILKHEAATGFGYGLPGIISVIQVIPFVGIFFLLVSVFLFDQKLGEK